jgi:GAF domain-containing protein
MAEERATTRVTELQERLERAQCELDRERVDRQRLEDERRGLSERYVRAEQKCSDLSRLYVAAEQLHRTLDRRALLTAIEEIVSDLFGSQELAIFEALTPGELALVGQRGVDPDRFPSIQIGAGLVGWAAKSGQLYLAGDAGLEVAVPGEQGLSVCVPLRLDDRLIGAIAVFGWLPHKATLEPIDRRLLELLATHAAAALYCTRLHAAVAGGPR